MSRKTGRNDPCPCGSGKKYKRCCLRGTRSADSRDPATMKWRRMRRLLEGVPQRMVDFVIATHGEQALLEAWDDAMHLDDAPFDPDSPEMAWVMPWILHCWPLEPEGTALADAAPEGVPPTRDYLARFGRGLPPRLRDYLEGCLASAFSIYEVEHTTPGVGFTLCDVLTGERREVLEATASRTLGEGHLVFAMLVDVEGITMAEAMAPYVISGANKPEIIRLRQWLANSGEPITNALLREYDFELIERYHALAAKPGRAMPELVNTDGESLAPQEVIFDLDAPENALAALAHLDCEATPEAPLAEVEREADGSLRRAVVTWKKPGNAQHGYLENTVLGRLVIEPARLTAEVNSDERAERIQTLVEQALGAQARYRVTSMQSVEQLKAQAYERAAAGEGGEPSDEGSDLNEMPEVQAKLQEMMEAHYASWPEQPLPALDGRTPLEAMQDPDGREMVEALVRDFERSSARMQPAPDPATFQRLRERLGLT